MKTQEAFHFIEQLKISNIYTPERYKANLVCVQKLVLLEEKYEKMWNDLKDLMDSTSVMDKLEMEYLGSKPKTKGQILNEVIDRLGVYMQVGRMSDIIKILVELRDEEEDV